MEFELSASSGQLSFLSSFYKPAFLESNHPIPDGFERLGMTKETIIRLPQVKQRLGLSRSTIYALIKDGKFSGPISLGSRAVGWLESDVSKFIETRIDASRKAK